MSKEILSPYVGLRPFESDENLLFFGRAEQTLEILQRLHENRFVAVVGSSGSGKSSIIRAGLIPALKGGYLVEDSSKWLIAKMKPGQNPMYNLAKSLLAQVKPDLSHTEILEFVKQIKKKGVNAILNFIEPLRKDKNINFFLLVDQFEELFRFTMELKNSTNKTEAVDFVNIILNLSKQSKIPFYVVLTMRSDFIGDCSLFHDLPEAMNKSQYLVPRLNRQQLKMVIEGPAKLFGAKFSPALTSRLLNDLGKVKDQLPLIQHCLMRIWMREMTTDKSGELNLDDYKAVGGIEKALSQHADEALESMSLPDRGIAKILFQALTEIDETSRKIRRPLLLNDLKELTGASQEKLLDVIDNFIRDKRSFLILENTGIKEDQIIDISHESLIRQWDTLSHWVDDEGESAAIYKKLAEDARLHQIKKKDLLSGSELQLSVKWRDEFKPTAVWANRYKEGFEENMDYLLKSEAEEKRLQLIENKRKRTLKNWTRAAIGSLVLIILISLLITAITSDNTKTRDLQDAARFLVNTDPTKALQFAAEAMERSEHGFFFYKLFYTPQEKENFKKTAQSIYSENTFYKRKINVLSVVNAVAYSPDGKAFLTGSKDSIARLWDLNGNTLHEFKGHSGEVLTVAFSPDGTNILTGSSDRTARLWNMKGDMIAEIDEKGRIASVDFAPDGNSILLALTDGKILLSDLNGITILESAKIDSVARYTSAVFSPNGKNILVGANNDARLFDLEGTLIQEFIGHKDLVTSVAFAPDGKSLITGSLDTMTMLWDLNGNAITEFIGHKGAITSVAYAPDGSSVLTGSGDNTARLWDPNGVMISEFRGHRSDVTSVAYCLDGQSIITGSRGKTVRLWDLKKTTLQVFKGHTEQVSSVAFSPKDNSILTGSLDQTVSLWNQDGTKITKFKRKGFVSSVTFAPDGNSVLIGSNYTVISRFVNSAEIWDLNDSLIKRILKRGHVAKITSVAFAPDGKTVLTGSEDDKARIWSVQGNLIKVFLGHKGPVTSVAFAPDGKTILTGSSDGIAHLWNLNGDSIQDFIGHQDNVTSVAFAPDGNSVLTGSKDNTVRLWNLNGTMITEFDGHNNSVSSIAFAPDGNTLLTGSDDKTIRLWDLKGTTLQEFTGHAGAVTSVAFSPDGQTILTGSSDQSARLWKIAMPLEDFLKTDWSEPLSLELNEHYGTD